MIKHIVMWKLKDQAAGLNREQIARKIKTDLEALVEVIPAIYHLEVGINVIPSDAAFDVGLYSEFESWENLKVYLAHPEHQNVVTFVREVITTRHVVDYDDLAE